MRRTIFLCLVLGLHLSLVGCGSSAYNQHVSFCKEELAAIESLIETFQTVKDKESAKTALPGIKTALDRYEKLPPKAAALPKVNARENSLLEQDYRAKLVGLSLKLDTVSRQALLDSGNDKGVKAEVMRMRVIAKDISKKLWDATH